MRFAAVDDLRVRAFDDEAVVFDPLSWDAHLLNPAALAVLDLFLSTPRSEVEVAAFLADALQHAEQAEAPAHAQRLIRELQSLGLIHCIEGTPHADR